MGCNNKKIIEEVSGEGCKVEIWIDVTLPILDLPGEWLSICFLSPLSSYGRRDLTVS